MIALFLLLFRMALHWLDPLDTMQRHTKQCKMYFFFLSTSRVVAVKTDEPAGQASFVQGCMRMRLVGQYNEKRPISPCLCVRTSDSCNDSYYQIHKLKQEERGIRWAEVMHLRCIIR